MKRFQVLSEELQNFEMLEDFQQYCIVDYISCPSVKPCEYDCTNREVCDDCKIKWLLEEWEN